MAMVGTAVSGEASGLRWTFGTDQPRRICGATRADPVERRLLHRRHEHPVGVAAADEASATRSS
jgi:hypothetical protein